MSGAARRLLCGVPDDLVELPTLEPDLGNASEDLPWRRMAHPLQVSFSFVMIAVRSSFAARELWKNE